MFRRETPFVGRDTEIRAVLEAFEAARQGTRQVCFISGEPGVGKTAVLNECIANMSASGGVAMTSAQCVEHYGSGEPYQPLLDALMRLCRQPGATASFRCSNATHPCGWLSCPDSSRPDSSPRCSAPLRAPPAIGCSESSRCDRDDHGRGSTRILSIEDLHWSDPSTLHWIATIATRPEPAKVLISQPCARRQQARARGRCPRCATCSGPSSLPARSSFEVSPRVMFLATSRRVSSGAGPGAEVEPARRRVYDHTGQPPVHGDRGRPARRTTGRRSGR